MVVPQQNPTKEKLLKLMADKDKLEEKIREFGDVLLQNDNVGLHGPLVDEEGFPRNDIDVFQVRQARQQIICLQNDHKALMKEIEVLLHQLHAETSNKESSERPRQSTAAPSNQSSAQSTTTLMEMQTHNGGATRDADVLPQSVIAKVNLVSPGSPAEDAGLRVGDEIIEFGTINANNFKNDLNEIGAIVRHMENQRIPLKVKRLNDTLELILIPKPWSGRGLLGCNIVLPSTN